MKKLTLLIAILMATSAWAQSTVLSCEGNYQDSEPVRSTNNGIPIYDGRNKSNSYPKQAIILFSFDEDGYDDTASIKIPFSMYPKCRYCKKYTENFIGISKYSLKITNSDITGKVNLGASTLNNQRWQLDGKFAIDRSTGIMSYNNPYQGIDFSGRCSLFDPSKRKF